MGDPSSHELGSPANPGRFTLSWMARSAARQTGRMAALASPSEPCDVEIEAAPMEAEGPHPPTRRPRRHGAGRKRLPSGRFDDALDSASRDARVCDDWCVMALTSISTRARSWNLLFPLRLEGKAGDAKRLPSRSSSRGYLESRLVRARILGFIHGPISGCQQSGRRACVLGVE